MYFLSAALSLSTGNQETMTEMFHRAGERERKGKYSILGQKRRERKHLFWILGKETQAFLLAPEKREHKHLFLLSRGGNLGICFGSLERDLKHLFWSPGEETKAFVWLPEKKGT